jgi:hypothetical protein
MLKHGFVASSGGRKPGAPIIGTATAGVNQASVEFSAPSYLGKPNNSLTYTAKSSPSDITATGSSSPIVVTGLTAGSSYTFSVKLNNTVIDSDFSSESNSITAIAPGPFFPPSFGPFFPPSFPPPPFFPPQFGPFFSLGLCIDGETEIMTPTGLVKAKNISVGDTVLSLDFNEISTEDEYNYRIWNSESLTKKIEDFVETTITNVIASVKDNVVYFNDKQESLYSLQQTMFVKDSDGIYRIKLSGAIGVGDTLIHVSGDGSVIEEPVIKVDFIEEDHTVYTFSAEPYDWFIAGGFLVHNK